MKKYRDSAPFLWTIGGFFAFMSFFALPSITGFIIFLCIGGFFVALGFRHRKVADIQALRTEFSRDAVILCGKKGDAWIVDKGVLVISTANTRKSIPLTQVQSYMNRPAGNNSCITIKAGIPDIAVHIGMGLGMAGGNTETIFYFEEESGNAEKLCNAMANHIGTATVTAHTQTEAINNAPGDSADEISKYKALLDNGAITQKEYDAKKTQLLGL